jgi:dienelactone hydrolase
MNKQIKGVANRFADQGFVGTAPHLFSAVKKAMMCTCGKFLPKNATHIEKKKQQKRHL